MLLRLGTRLLTYIFAFSSSPVLLNGMKDGESLVVIPQDPSVPGAIPILRSSDQHDGLVFTWSSWIYIKQPIIPNNGCPPDQLPANCRASNAFHHIWSKGSNHPGADGIMAPNNAPGLYLSADHTRLLVAMSTFDTPNEEIIIDDIPIGHWISVIIRQDQHRLDVFINGTLARSVILNGVPKQNYDPVLMGLNGGFSGYLSQVQYFAYALGANKIQQLVNAGPNLKANADYNDTTHDYLSFRWYFPLQASEMQ
tara:strand:+ start:1 stop:759 length:759 start_codon:yes stop_codon:yes gene_type:complete